MEKNLLETPPTREDLVQFAKVTPGGVRNMVTPNTQMPDYQEHYAGKELTDDQLLDLFVRVPNLLKKPMVTEGTRILQGTSDPARLAEFVGAVRT